MEHEDSTVIVNDLEVLSMGLAEEDSGEIVLVMSTRVNRDYEVKHMNFSLSLSQAVRVLRDLTALSKIEPELIDAMKIPDDAKDVFTNIWHGRPNSNGKVNT